jgi:hypothetical protein
VGVAAVAAAAATAAAAAAAAVARGVGCYVKEHKCVCVPYFVAFCGLPYCGIFLIPTHKNAGFFSLQPLPASHN